MAKLLTSMWHACDALSMETWYGKLLIGAGTALTAVYSPIVALLVCCFVFTAADMFYGIKVACKQQKKITSSKNWKGTIIKLLDELTLISLARLLEYSVLGSDDVFVLTGGITVIISLTELWSIIENLNTLNPSGPWKALGKFLKKKGEDYIGTEIDLSDEHIDSTESVDSKS